MNNEKVDLIIEKNEVEKIINNLKNEKIIENVSQENNDTKKIKIKQSIQDIRNFLLEVKYKETIEKAQELNEKRENIEKLEKDIISYEQLIQQRDKLKQEIIENNTMISAYDKQIKNLENEMIEINKTKEQLELNLKNINIDKIRNDKKILDSITENFNNLKSIELDYKQIQNQTKQLKEDEKIVNNLYNIFSKELLTYILSEYLPILTEIINNFLTQIVQYQIKIQVEIKNDIPQMQVKIIDEK